MKRRGYKSRRRHSVKHELWWYLTGFGFAGLLIGLLAGMVVYLFMASFDLLPWWVNLFGGVGIGGMCGTSYCAAMEDMTAAKWRQYHIYRVREER